LEFPARLVASPRDERQSGSGQSSRRRLHAVLRNAERVLNKTN